MTTVTPAKVEEKKKTSKWLVLLLIFISLVVLHFLRFGLESLFFMGMEHTVFNDRLASVIVMLLLSAAIILWSRVRHIKLWIFPERINWFLWVEIVVFVLLVGFTIYKTRVFDMETFMMMVYSVLAVPLFEELVFRSLVWNELKESFSHTLVVYLLSSVLFGLWRVGYLDSYLFSGDANFLKVVSNRALLGLVNGLLLGIAKLQTRKILPSILLNSILKLLGL